MQPIIYYGQNREDLILAAFFPNRTTGFYVDVGACHPVKYSVTQYFYERGWSGINIEPQEREHKLLEKARRRDINLMIGLSNKKGKMKLRVYENESLSTLSKDVKSDYKNDKDRSSLSYTDKNIEVKTLKSVLTENDVDSIQFLKVDVEGYEEEVLKGNDWKKYRPEVLCIETNNLVAADKWEKVVVGAGYEKVYFDGLNNYYVEKGSDLKNTFLNEFQRQIVSKPTLAYEWKIQFERTTNQLERVQKTLDNYVAENKALRENLIQLNEKKLRKKVAKRVKKLVNR